MVKYCEICERNVEPKKKFNWIVFLVLFLSVIGPLVYVLYYFLLKGKRCPICNGKQFDKAINSRKARRAMMEIKGHGGILIVNKNNIIIKRKGINAFLLHGMKGDKEIPMKSITSIQFKRNGRITSGYIQFSIKGSSESKGGIMSATNDENTIVFSKKEENEFEKAKDYIMKKIQ